MSDVSCNGCSSCCRHQIVQLTDQDEPNMAVYNYRRIGDLRVLNNKPNGECAHLDGHLCSIYERRPQVCRTYDCRKHWMILPESEQRRFRKSDMGRAGYERLNTLDAGDIADLPAYRQRATPAIDSKTGRPKTE